MTPVQLPEVPAHIGLIVGVRLTPSITNEFFGYFEPNYRGLEKERVYTAAQLREYATEAVMADRVIVAARVADLSAWLRSGNDVPADLPFVFRERWQKIVADIRALESTITPSETNSER